MKSTFYATILALACSVAAAPVSSRSGLGDERSGAPTFAGDTSHPYTPPKGLDPKQSSPTANKSDESNVSNNSGESSVSHNSTTPAAPYTTSNSTSTNTTTYAHIDKRKVYAPSRLVTPDVKSFVSKSGYTMFGMQNPVCSDVTLIFARGTTEVGNMGTCVGPELAEELRDLMPSLSVQGVDYPANSQGNTEYGASGGPYMAMLAREARKQCPDTKIVLAGYSQGARCIHGALGESEKPFDGSDVAAVVAFGDPLNGKNKLKGIDRDDVLQVCGDSDDRCQDGQVDMQIHGGHISYGKSAKDVAKWIKKTVG